MDAQAVGKSPAVAVSGAPVACSGLHCLLGCVAVGLVVFAVGALGIASLSEKIGVVAVEVLLENCAVE